MASYFNEYQFNSVLFRLAPTGTSAEATWTQTLNPAASLAVAMCWVRIWQVTMAKNGISVMAGMQAMRCLVPASKVSQPRLTRTTTTSSLEPLERTIGKVVNVCVCMCLCESGSLLLVKSVYSIWCMLLIFYHKLICQWCFFQSCVWNYLSIKFIVLWVWYSLITSQISPI